MKPPATNKPLVGKDAIAHFLPHRDPVIMVDELLEQNEQDSWTRLAIRDGIMFMNDGVLTEAGLLEHMAESAAAGAGWQFRATGASSPIVYLGSISDLKIHRLPAYGSTIVTHIKTETTVLAITQLYAETYEHDQLIACCRLRTVNAG